MGSIPYTSQQAIFYQQYETVRRDEVVGILYLCFFWTGITAILGIIECFFMPGRVREFNAIQAAGIAAALGIPTPGWGQPINVTVNMPQAASPAEAPAATLLACPRCQNTNPAGARFCAGCGGAL